MKKNNKIPISCRLEEYAFGAVALKEEIKRHKREDKIPWSPIKYIEIRVIYIYSIIAVIVIIIWMIILNGLDNLGRLIRRHGD